MSLRDELYAVVDRLVESLEKAPRGDDLIDQYDSPLGKQKHIDAIKSGRLKGYVNGKQYFALRSDLNAFVFKSPVVPKVSEAATEDAAADRILAEVRRSK